MMRKLLLLLIGLLLFSEGFTQFVENKGQVFNLNQEKQPQVKYYYELENSSVYFESNRVVYTFLEMDKLNEGLKNTNTELYDEKKKELGATMHRMDMHFVDANPNPVILKSQEVTAGNIHFYLNKRNGIRDVASYKTITYKNIYPQIDLKFYQSNKGLKYDFILHSGADINDIKIEYDGASLSKLEDQLSIKTSYKTISEDIPLSFINDDKNLSVDVDYIIQDNGFLSFTSNVKNYDKLTIDPVLEWATYFNTTAGSTGNLDYYDYHLDASGNTYLYGQVFSGANNYPVTNPGVPAYVQNYNNNSDLYIAKFDNNKTLVWSTYLGGSDIDQSYGSEKIATRGNVLHIVGERISNDAPFVNGGGYYSATGSDAFWARFDLTTGALTHLTGLGAGLAPSIAVSQSSGQVAIIMEAYDFSAPPILARTGAYNQSTNGGLKDMYLFLTDNTYNQIWGTFLGGPSTQESFMCLFDNNDNILFVGETEWNTSSTAANEQIQNLTGAYNDNTANGGTDVMLGRFSNTGALEWNTLYGGDESDARQGAMGGYVKILMHPTTDELVMVFNTNSTNLITQDQGGGAYFKTVPTHPSFSDGGSFWNYASYFCKFDNNLALNHASYLYSSTEGDLIHDAAFSACDKLYFAGRIDDATSTTVSLPAGFNNPTGDQTYVYQLDATTYEVEWSSFLANDQSGDPAIAARTDNPQVYIATESFRDNGPTVDPGGGALYQANSINGTGSGFMLWQLHPTLPPEISGDIDICIGTPTTLTASGGAGAPFNWYTSASGGTAVETGSTFNTPNLIANTTYYVSSGSGLCESPRVPVSININAAPAAPNVSSNSPVCIGNTIELYANTVSGATYNWFGPNGFSSADEDPTIPSATSAMSGDYFATVTVAGCTSDTSSAATVTIVTTPPTPGPISGDTEVCNLSSGNYSISGVPGAATYNWQYSGTGTVSGSATTVTLTPTTSGTLTVTATNTCGTSGTQSLAISVIDVPAAPGAISGNTNLCVGDTESFTINSVTDADSYNWSFSGTGTLNETGTSATLTPTSNGTLSVTASNNCGTSASQDLVITVSPVEDASFSYPSATACVNGSDLVPTITGTTGGIFTANNGLIIDANTGEIDVSANTPGNYIITYTTSGTCSDSQTANLSINSADDASFAYSASAYCQNGTFPTPTITGLAGGTFTSTSGLSIDASTGSIDVSASNAGTYSVTYTTNGTCPSTSTTSVTINALDDASFSFSSNGYCADGIDPTPTITGLTGGTFTINNGGIIDANTGQIDVDASGVGTYTITYITNGACPNTETFNIQISTAPDASFSYSGSPYCSNDVNPIITLGSGASAGTFTAGTGLSINATTGEIDLSTSTPGTYTITNTVASSGSCAAAVSTATITIVPSEDASFTYSNNTFCLSSTNPLPTITGTTGGTFNIDNGGVIDNSTGEVDITNSGLGTFTITYVTSTGVCSDTETFVISVNTSPSADFSYNASPYCEGSGVAAITLASGSSIGTFTDQGVTGNLAINSTTGEIDLDNSSPGTYTIQNTIAASGGCPAITANTSITVTPQDDASFNYGGSTTFCENDGNPLASLTGTTGGVFTSNPANGIDLDGSTGEINMGNSILDASYDVIYTTGGVCSDADTLTITLNSSPTVPTVGTTSGNDTICEGQSVELIASGSVGTGVTYSIYDAPTGGNNLGNTPLTITPSLTTSYYIESFNSNGCGNIGGRQEVQIVVNPLPSVDAGADVIICPGDTETLSVTGSGSILWSTSETTNSIDVTPNNTTTYTVTITDGNNCSNSDDVEVAVQSVGSITAVDDSFAVSVATNTTLDILQNDTQSSSITSIITNPINGSSSVNANQSISYTGNTDYTGTDNLTYVICDAVCTSICDTAEVSITIQRDDFIITEGFSPNGDGINDTYTIVGIENFPNNALSIFNRWGDLVFEAAPYINNWDGSSNGNGIVIGDEVTTGTYYYILDLGDGSETYKGFLEIKKK